MIDLYETRQRIDGFTTTLEGLAESLDMPELSREINELNAKTEAPEFWNDQA